MTMTREDYRKEIAEVHELMKEWVRKAADPSNIRSKLSKLMIDHDLIVKNHEKSLFSTELWDKLYGVLSMKDELKSKVAIETMNARYFWNVVFHPVHNNLHKALELLNEAADFIEKSLNEKDKEALERVKRRTAEAKAEKDRGWNLMDACSNMGDWLD